MFRLFSFFYHSNSSFYMILIADSGATKTDWCFGTTLQNCQIIHTEGINPFHLTEEKIKQILQETLVEQLPFQKEKVKAIFFYGSGCTPEKAGKLSNVLAEVFPCASIQVESDLLGAARALYMHQPGIACILGTGANSCLYDGQRITHNTPPLGYILGDEGSGAYLGKRFISDCIKQQLPSELLEGLLKEYDLTVPDILDKVYKQPQGNRFLASLTPYIYKYKSRPEVRQFLTECFSDFFRRNILPYPKHAQLSVSFAGSVAWFFQDELKETARKLHLHTGIFIQSPIQELKAFHLSEKTT